jgi:hypothetical protein
MKKHNLYSILYLLILFSCNNKPQKISIWMENGSDVKEEVSVSISINGTPIDTILIRRDSIADKFQLFYMNIPADNKSVSFLFNVIGTKEEAICIVQPDSLSDESFIHVNFSEVLFKKGYLYNSTILLKDTIVERKLFAKILYKGLSE